jgi:Fatty acid hydroxylase superfamily
MQLTTSVILTLFLPCLALAIEILALGWRRSSVHRAIFDLDNSLFSDLIFFGFSVIGLRDAFVVVGSLGLAYFTGTFSHFAIREATGLNLYVRTGYGLLDAFLYLLAFSFFDYWNHRLEHIGPLWYLHRLHHSATSLSPMVSARNHPVELALEPFVRAWPLALFSVSPVYFFVISGLDSFYNYLVHIDAPWSWGWFGRWILISPLAHRIHHSPLPEHFNKNLSMLVAWDRVFGTWYEGTTINETVGLHESNVHNNGNLIAECVLDVGQFLRGLKNTVFQAPVRRGQA